jgi:hypothetical protein
MTRWSRGALAAFTLALLAGTPPGVRAEAPAKPVKKTPAKPADDAPLVFTNDDLERMFGPSEPAAPPAAVAPVEAGSKPAADDPLKRMEADKAAAGDRAAGVAEAEKKLAAAQANLDGLEKQLLATRNPYLPRPKLSEEDARKLEGKSGPERVELTEEQIEAARREVDKARADLERAKSGS